MEFTRSEMNAKGLCSLAWHGDELVDVLAGGVTYYLDGTCREPNTWRRYAYPFDAVLVRGRYAVIYEELGTKGLQILWDDRDWTARQFPTRELNRSYYFAKDYAYPIALFDLPDGRPAIAHCPNEYNALELELVEGGDRLTRRENSGVSGSIDCFHSRLQASGDGRFLLDLGWVWHPWNIIAVYDVEKALADPRHLDSWGVLPSSIGEGVWEADSAAFCGRNVAIGYIGEPSHPEEATDAAREGGFELRPAESGVPEQASAAERSKIRKEWGSDVVITDSSGAPLQQKPAPKKTPSTPGGFFLLTVDLGTGKVLSAREMPELLGRLMGAGADHVVSFYDYPKLIETRTGKVTQRWEDIDPGPERGQPSAMMRPPSAPFLAMDPAHARFAVGTENHLTVIQLRGL